MVKKLQLEPFYIIHGKKGLRAKARAVVKQINDLEDSGTVNKYVTPLSLEDKSRSERWGLI